ncbi:hypothetical protein FOZ61_010027 [Perkinsus olseni]|uniref:RAP domain-containing protein n=1 Tax=Perkinsus olseni TaxID=32597 RepID=A0A7J6M4Y1_PEROL|nr:hypothetical protein FOZ61_010027 [Perkinsus olseni]KAF4672485.1 hypothetical protein FOL46_008878 [Perkinsus olseni]
MVPVTTQHASSSASALVRARPTPAEVYQILKSCGSAGELREIYTTHKRSFDIRCHAEYIDRLARLTDDKVPKLQEDHWQWVERALGKFQQNGFLHAPTVREGLGRLCHAVARCSPDDITFHQVLSKTMVVAPLQSMSPPALTATMWSLATLHVNLQERSPYRVPLSLVAEHCASSINLVDKTPPVVKAMWAAIKVDVGDPVMQNLYRQGLAHTMDLHVNKGVPLTLKDVILLLWGSATLSKLGPVSDIDKLIMISSKVICGIHEGDYEIDPQNTTMALWSLANFQPDSSANDLVCRVISESLRNADASRLSPFELSLVLWSMGKLYETSSSYLRDRILQAVVHLQPQVESLLHVFSLRQVANVLWAFGATRIDDCRGLFDKASLQEILKTPGRVSSSEYRQSIANIAWAYATHDYASDSVSSRVRELLSYFTTSRYDEMTSQHAATVAWALWRMRGMEPNSVQDMARIADRYGDRFANRHVITLTRAAAGAKFYHPSLLEAILRRPISSWTPDQCGQLLWVLATWGVPHDRRMIEYATRCDAVVRSYDYTSDGDDTGLGIDKLTTIEWATAVLDLPPPKCSYLWDKESDYVEAQAADLTVSQVLRQRLADSQSFSDMGLTQLYWAWVLRHDVEEGIDIASPSRKIAVEVDGRAFHSVYDVSTQQTFIDASARVKKRLLERQGWRVLRISEQDFVAAEGKQRKYLATALSQVEDGDSTSNSQHVSG